MDKFKYIEDNLLELVKGCINDKDFMTNPIILDTSNYDGHGRFTRDITGVRVYDVSLILKQTREIETCNSNTELVKTKKIILTFEHEPKIEIIAESINETKNIIHEVKTIQRDSYCFKDKIANIFRGKSYKKNVEIEVTTYEIQYKLVCGEFSILLTNEQVDELVNLYESNVILFKKEKEAFEIHKRIKKFVK